MICVDDASSRRHRKLGMCVQCDGNGPDGVGLQTRIGGHDRLLASWHHRKLVPLCLRWKDMVQRFGLTLLLLVSIIVVVVIWVSQMASAEFTTDTSFLFVSVGDFGSGTNSQEKVAEQVFSHLSLFYAHKYPNNLWWMFFWHSLPKTSLTQDVNRNCKWLGI